MASSGTLPRATADEAFVGLLIDHDVIDADLVDDVRAALASDPNGMGLTEALIDAGVLPLETTELFLEDLVRGVLSCPGCGGRFNVRTLKGGTRFKCKSCGVPVTVPRVQITRSVLGAFGDHGAAVSGALAAGGGVTIEEPDDLPRARRPAPKAAAATDLSEDELEAIMSGGTGDGQLLDFTDMDVDAEDYRPLTAGAPAARKERPRRSSRRGAAEDDDEAEAEKDPDFWKRFAIWVVAPIIIMFLGIYFTPDIKRAMMGSRTVRSDNDTGGATAPADETPYVPSIRPDECDDWKAAETSAKEAIALLGTARSERDAGNPDKARSLYDQALAKFAEAYESYGEVESKYESSADVLRPTVDGWQAHEEAARAEQGELAGK